MTISKQCIDSEAQLNKPELLLLCNRPAQGSNADTILDHLDSINNMPGWIVRELSILGSLPAALNLDQFDAVGIHYTLHISDPQNHWLSRSAMGKISQFKGAKCIWLHDEYRRVNDSINKLKYMGINTIFTVIPENVATQIYTKDKIGDASVHTILSGYVSSNLKKIKSPEFNDRAIDVFYRSRRPPMWLGKLGQEKIEIGVQTKALSKKHNIVADISVEEADRVYANKWIEKLKDSKATLCVESGSSVIDFTGEIEKKIEQALSSQPDSNFEQVEKFLHEIDGKIIINCISPRVFEMAACRTLIIAYPGEYSGIIKPWLHYVPLEKDFSNFNEVIEILKDPVFCKKIIDRTHQDLIESGLFSYDVMSKFCANHIPKTERKVNNISCLTWFWQRHISLSFILHNYIAQFIQKYILSGRFRSILISIWLSLPINIQKIFRPFLKILGR